MDVNNLPYAEWLEKAIRLLAEQDVKCIAMAARVNDGEVLTAYYETEMADKALLATHIQGDALFDMALANAKTIVAAAEEQEDDDE